MFRSLSELGDLADALGVQGGWDAESFLTDYFGIAFVFVAYCGYKLVRKTKIVALRDMDFQSFVPEFDKLEEDYAAR